MGMYVNSASATTRGLEISADDFMVKDSSFTKLRQPAYINGFKGTLERNTVSTSRGWVVVGNSNVTFTGNMWSNNVPNDIAIIDDDNNATTLAVNNYPCSVVNTIKANNNNAVIDNQLLGRTCAATPVVSTVLVTPDDTKGWTQSDTRTNGKVDYVTDSSSPFPVGALSLKTDVSPVSGQDKAQYYVYPYVSSTFYLSDVSGSLGYSTKQNSASFSAGLPAYQIAVYLQNASNADTFATLTYEPYVDKGNGAVQNGQWQNWAIDRSSSKFYVSKNVVNANGSVTASQGSSTYTLDQINAIFPNAKVIGYGANVGSNNPGYDTEVDGFTFNNTTYDFDPTPVSVTPGSGGAGGGNTGSGSSTGGQGLTTTLGAISPLVATANNPSDLASSTVGALGVTTPTATDKDGDEETLGAQTKKAAKTPVVEATNNGWNIMGLAWYWWVLILAALAAIWWFLVARRRNADEN
jgi:hypothetical protein